jgi:hypothetical protein
VIGSQCYVLPSPPNRRKRHEKSCFGSGIRLRRSTGGGHRRTYHGRGRSPRPWGLSCWVRGSAWRSRRSPRRVCLRARLCGATSGLCRAARARLSALVTSTSRRPELGHPRLQGRGRRGRRQGLWPEHLRGSAAV